MILNGFTTLSEKEVVTVIDDETKTSLDKKLSYVTPIISKASIVLIKLGNEYYLYKTKEEFQNIRFITAFNYVILPYSDMKKSVLEDYEKSLKISGKEETPESLMEYLQTEFKEETSYNIIIDINR